LLRLVTPAVAERAGAGEGLRAEIRRCLSEENDAAFYDALRAAPSDAVYRMLWQAICSVVEAPVTEGAGIVARPFAIPVVFVAGSRAPKRVPGAISDVGEVQSLIERHGAIGATRNFGLSAELVALEALERLRPSRVYRWNSDFAGGGIGGMAGEAMEVTAGREQAHLRFLVGAGVAPAHLPSFLETAADIGRWGTPFTRVLARQLAQEGLELLPLARPPAVLLDAPHRGRRAVLDTAFQLFASHVIRDCRMTAGEPTIIVSAHRMGRSPEVRVSVSSMYDDTWLEGFRWPLHPLDDLAEITATIAELLDACRVTDVNWLPDVVAESAPGAASEFFSVRDLGRNEASRPV
jgi:hypothetical protein